MLSVPIDLRQACMQLGLAVQVEAGYSRNVGGFSVVTPDGNRVIVINADPGRARVRFTWAHEIGHAFLADEPDVGLMTHRERERWCDQFAAALLMPGRLLESALEYARRCWRDPRDRIRYLMSVFDVSRASLLRRLVELDLNPTDMV